MSTTFTWGINTLERETSDGFVFTAHYTINDEKHSPTKASGTPW